ncbi:hypothetical protein PISMIDRAFT_24328 [Pisolithus microcarpus 441]|uniref:Uncharacterized protein n=1 Tax=Pisolithus microcarpus 441 TaxID=765257 RepID=A0A0C9ZAZ8_9AGAM|nr:hypothetical protein BKA83DRAFT_24328 [Pisolithus microcarpus]KIK19662.1 hypothetical protein PISMIDRAFT_24328 [Pisolithus microcarpus 441]
METALNSHDEVLLSIEDLIKADPYCAQGLTHVPLSSVLDIAYQLFQKHTNLELIAEHRQYSLPDLEHGSDNLFNASQILQLILHSFSLSASSCPDSEGYNDAVTSQVLENGHGQLERCLKDVWQKISEVKEIQERLVDNKHVITAEMGSVQQAMKNVGETLKDHEGQLSALDNTQRRVAEEFGNLETRLMSLQKNRMCNDASLKDIQASLTNLETNLASYRHDLRQQLRDKSSSLHQCISDSLTGLQSTHLSLDERLTILEKKADGIRTTQDKHTALFSQALAGIHSLSEGFMALLDHSQDINLIWAALRDMQKTMESVEKSFEQISGDGSSEVSQSWVGAQLSLEEELLCSSHGHPITPSRAFDDSEGEDREDPLHHTIGTISAAPNSDVQKNLATQLYHHCMAVICSVVPVLRVQSGILLTTFEWWILRTTGYKLSGAKLHTLILTSTVVFLVSIGFFSVLRGLPKTQEVVDQPLWYALRYGGLPSNVR